VTSGSRESSGRAAVGSVEVSVLTERHWGVLALVAGGASNKEIAAALGCTRKNVEYHVSQLLKRLRAPNRAALAAFFTAESSSGRAGERRWASTAGGLPSAVRATR
jgi:DNA-binding NarL/FixJ family response regulator